MIHRRFCIVGAGLSGLAAGVTLTARGIPVTILEQKPNPGGRAYSFRDPTTGDIIDNGQHVLIAGYHRTMKFLDTIGTRDLLAVQSLPSMLFHHPERGFGRLQLPRVPSPFHLLFGLLAFGIIPFSDRVRLLRAGLSLLGSADRHSEQTIGAWLGRNRQTAECERSFWEPLAVSIMNEHIGVASAECFIRSLQAAFIGNPRNAALAIPTVGLSELYVVPARAFIEGHGGTIECNADVTAVHITDNRAVGLEVRNREDLGCDALVLAVPPHRLRALLPAERNDNIALSGMESVAHSPIVSIHLWFEEDRMPHEFVGLIGRRVQWVFNKRKIEREKRPGGHISAVISAAHDFVDHTNEELVRITLEDLRSAYPEVPATPTHAVVIREKRATFSLTPAVELLRIGPRTRTPNLFLAGDWTDTGLPATIEGAILSGERAADLAGEYLQMQPQTS